MSKPEFTEGPWHWQWGDMLYGKGPLEKVLYPSIGCTPKGFSYAKLECKPADRLLLAAAPMLYSALEAVLTASLSSKAKDWQDALKAAEKALAEARGDNF